MLRIDPMWGLRWHSNAPIGSSRPADGAMPYGARPTATPTSTRHAGWRASRPGHPRRDSRSWSSPAAPAPEIAPDLRVHEIRDEAAALDYVGVVAEAYDLAGIPAPTAAAMFFSPESVLQPEIAAYVVYLGDVAVSGSMTFVRDGAACVLWVATTQAARRRGLGAASMALATRASFAMGARVVTLQASRQGLPIGSDLGILK